METKAPQRVEEANAAGLVVGLSTAPSNEEARAIAEHLVTQHLAACVQIVPAVESIYEWKGTIEKSSEVLIIIKTQRAHTQAVVQAIKDMHSYEVPEVVFTDIVDGNADYIKWARAVTQPKGT
ncbi:CutA1 divalent ion tolerance domain-containing protein, putative [Eimeria acervulina]|uniref:CutA1 divalent ion tolerance domain-containing protein, putative n=1 Tax=Eimeria acervulina TaxID=5801 RepID=U6G7S7_EIMAC|nr:CutA1 divalent ion tolerance domain-containing protein, putative [Eimeria acervulina]CDI76311.1 CutA1 divalent ion tolerance domain-containing protein, putative [Eimeria acervulina]